VFDYENENLMRRFVHMYRRIDQMSYSSKLKPYAESLKNMLDETDLKIMCKYKLNTDLDFFVRNRKNIISTPVILNNDSSIGEIINKIQSKYENKIGKKLYILNQPTIYKYIGNRAKHLWHVDPCNKDTIYNSITCIKKIGNISPLQYKDKNGDIHSIHFNEGDAALFNGGVTVHQVPQSKDANSERTVLSIAFTSEKKDAILKTNNFCKLIKSGNNKLLIYEICVGVLIVTRIVGSATNAQKLKYKYVIPMAITSNILMKYFPLILPLKIGARRSSSIKHNLVLYLFTILISLSPKYGILTMSYFGLSEIFAPSSWVQYD